jgi:hypothetical protein
MKDISLNTLQITNGKANFIPWSVDNNTKIMVNDTTAQVDLIDVEDDERELLIGFKS